MTVPAQSPVGAPTVAWTAAREIGGTTGAPAAPAGAATDDGSLVCLFVSPSGQNQYELSATTTVDGVTWSSPNPFKTLSTRGVPAIAAAQSGGTTYCCLFEAGTGSQLVCGDVADWSSAQPIPGTDQVGAPSLAVMGGVLYCAAAALADGGVVCASTADGTTWSTPVRVPGAFAVGAPAIVSFNGRLYAAWEDVGTSDGRVWLTSSPDGEAWRSPEAVPALHGAPGQSAPSLGVFNGQLWCTVVGGASAAISFVVTSDGVSWSEPVAAPGTVGEAHPAMVTLGARLHWLLPGTTCALMSVIWD